MSYTPRDHKSDPWVANNGLRVESRTSQGFWLTWKPSEDDLSLKVLTPTVSFQTSSQYGNRGFSSDNASMSSPPVKNSVTGATEGLEGPWYEIQMRPGPSEDWETVYRGYRQRFEVQDLTPDQIVYFRMKRNGDDSWGSTIIAATDTAPANAKDLHDAVLQGNEGKILRIIGNLKGVQLRKLLQSHDTAGMTPLMIACRSGNWPIAELIIKAGAWVNAPSFHTERTALMYACMSGNLRMLEFMDKWGADWTMKDKNGCNAFHHAVNSDKLAAIKYGVARCGISIVNETDKLGWTPLLRSIIVGTSIDVIQFLLSKGADPNATDLTKDKSCLIAAVMVEKKNVCDLLMDFGADPTFKNSNGKTAYDIASSRGYRDIADSIVKILMDLAADKSKPSEVKEKEPPRLRHFILPTEKPVAAYHNSSAASSARVHFAPGTRFMDGSAVPTRHGPGIGTPSIRSLLPKATSSSPRPATPKPQVPVGIGNPSSFKSQPS